MDSVISLSQYKHHKDHEAEICSFESYLSVLSFNQLVQEAQLLIAELKSVPLESELKDKCSAFLKEFKNRISIENPSVASNETFASLLKQF